MLCPVLDPEADASGSILRIGTIAARDRLWDIPRYEFGIMNLKVGI